MLLWGRAPGFFSSSRFSLILLVPSQVHGQAIQLGKIMGTVRVARGDFPAHPVLVPSKCGARPLPAPIARTSGRFGFYGLAANEYKITVNDDAYEPFSATVESTPRNHP